MKNKRGQITIFVIIAIVIVALIILGIIFWPDIKVRIFEINPSQFIQECSSDSINQVKEQVLKQGGSFMPEHTIMYEGNNIEYLCFTGEVYKTCVNQRPLLMKHVREEIEKNAEKKVSDCLFDLKSDLESKGFNVIYKKPDLNLEFTPEKMKIEIDVGFSAAKDDESHLYDKFTYIEDSATYDLVMIATSILNWEARYGDSETTVYMTYYPEIKVEKIKRGEGSTIYKLSHRTTGEEFNFASRSIAWPAGYGVQEVSYN